MSLLISLQIKVGPEDNTCTSSLLENCVQKLTFDVVSLLFVDEITVHLEYRKLYHILDNYCIEHFCFVSGNLDNIASTQVADKLQRLLFNYTIKTIPLLCRFFHMYIKRTDRFTLILYAVQTVSDAYLVSCSDGSRTLPKIGESLNGG